MALTFLTAVFSFISTNIDNLFVLMILYSQAQTAQEYRRIAAGQYFGNGAFVALGLLGAWGTQILPSQMIRLLGLLPLFLGIRAWIEYRRAQGQENQSAQRTQIRFLSVFLLTVANGADNIGVYVPVFSGLALADLLVTLAVFAILLGLWCSFGKALVNFPLIKEKLARYQPILVSTTLIVLGLVILVKN